MEVKSVLISDPSDDLQPSAAATAVPVFPTATDQSVDHFQPSTAGGVGESRASRIITVAKIKPKSVTSVIQFFSGMTSVFNTVLIIDI